MIPQNKYEITPHKQKSTCNRLLRTIGSELVDQLLHTYGVEELICLDSNESELFFQEQHYKSHPEAHFFLANVRDKEKLKRKCQGIDVLFHTAAYKHVELCEKSPFEAVQTNILGVRNIIDAACECGWVGIRSNFT